MIGKNCFPHHFHHSALLKKTIGDQTFHETHPLKVTCSTFMGKTHLELVRLTSVFDFEPSMLEFPAEMKAVVDSNN